MNDEQKRIAIAEACGFKSEPDRFYTDRRAWITPSGERCATGDLPDYLNDLNAMHEAEKVLTDNQAMKYRFKLSMNSDGPKAEFVTVEAAMCHATARQRADAFLAVINQTKP